jgi:hypothetical protein
MKKIAANMQTGSFPTTADLRRTAAVLPGDIRSSRAWRARTTAKAATSVAAAAVARTTRQPNTSAALDARRRPVAEPRNWVAVKRPKLVPQ